MGQPVVNIMKSLGEFGSTGSCVMLTLGYGPININLPILPSNCLKKKKNHDLPFYCIMYTILIIKNSNS